MEDYIILVPRITPRITGNSTLISQNTDMQDLSADAPDNIINLKIIIFGFTDVEAGPTDGLSQVKSNFFVSHMRSSGIFQGLH